LLSPLDATDAKRHRAALNHASLSLVAWARRAERMTSHTHGKYQFEKIPQKAVWIEFIETVN